MQDRTVSLEGAQASRIKKAELLGGVGALVLGMGLGLLFSSFLKPYAVPVLLVGLLMHAWGMLDKHGLETASSRVRLWWTELLYWACWIALLILTIYLTVSYLRG
jgi:hypothetical protein